MSLADIKTKISAEAKAQIKAVESENAARVAVVAQQADAGIKAVQAEYRDRFAGEEPEIARRREIVARLDADKIDLGVRQKLISEAFDGALRLLAELPSDKYLSFVGTLLEKASESGEEILLIGNSERHIDSAWLDGYNSSHQTRLSLDRDRLPISGGFVLRNGKIDVNCSWDMLVEDIRGEIEPGVVKRLFS